MEQILKKIMPLLQDFVYSISPVFHKYHTNHMKSLTIGKYTYEYKGRKL